MLDGGGNLQWPETRPNGQPEPPATATVVWAQPVLLPLGDYGGLTATAPPDDVSPAVGGGVAGGAPPTDQRGVPRILGMELVGQYILGAYNPDRC